MIQHEKFEFPGSYASRVCVLKHVQLCDSVDCRPCDFLSMGFPRQESWSGLPFPPPGDLPNPGIEPRSPELQADSLPLNHLRSPPICCLYFPTSSVSYTPL